MTPGLRVAALAAVFGLGLTASRAATLADGERAYAGGRYSAARAIWTDLAASGDAQAAYHLGTLFERGDGVRSDAATALCWYQRAATGGVVPAAFNAGVMFDSGRGTAQDPHAAALWYGRAAASGFARAAYNLAQLYAAGAGVPRDQDMAAAWFHIAAATLPAATERLARLPPAPAAAEAPAPAPRPVRLDPPPEMPAAAAAKGVPLTWVAAPEGAALSYYVEVMADDFGLSQPIFWTTTPLSAALAPLPPGHYAGRVVVMAADGTHYAIGGWTEFTAGLVAPDAGPRCAPKP